MIHVPIEERHNRTEPHGMTGESPVGDIRTESDVLLHAASACKKVGEEVAEGHEVDQYPKSEIDKDTNEDEVPCDHEAGPSDHAPSSWIFYFVP